MPSNVDFDFSELTRLSDRIQQGDTMVKITLNDGLRALARLFVPAKGTGPLADDTPKLTGKLARSTFFQITGSGIRQIITILQPARTPDGDFYGEFVREGTKAHVIKPKNKKALHFVMAGADVFAMSVNHPGTTANPYHKRTMARMKPRAQDIIHKIGEKITAYISGQ